MHRCVHLLQLYLVAHHEATAGNAIIFVHRNQSKIGGQAGNNTIRTYHNKLFV